MQVGLGVKQQDEKTICSNGVSLVLRAYVFENVSRGEESIIGHHLGEHNSLLCPK